MKTDTRPRVSGPLAPLDRAKTPKPQPAPPTEPETSSIHQTISPEQAAAASVAPPRVPRKFTPAEFNTAMVHYYRGEVSRANTWRNRLDTTTNWAVLTTGATLSFAFSSPTNPHFVIVINSILVSFFLIMEARRYRYYEIWSSRVRVLETGYFTQVLAPDLAPDEGWVEHLLNDLKTPHFTISEWEAIGRRLRRNYLWIFALLAAAWNLKVYLHPVPAYDFNAFIDRATVGLVPGEVVFVVGVIFNVGVFIFAMATVRLREAVGEVLPEHDFHPIQKMTDWTRAATTKRQTATVRRAKKARERTRATTTPRTGVTGEWKRPDLARAQQQQSSDDIHRTQFPHKEPALK
ncbi:MAG TPA: DUF2270 domain-containing protein [Pyrinomonadaceae bacterium]|nr:DUF2270 domain-containing protein [Pyrinomonadaceae bacterium]